MLVFQVLAKMFQVLQEKAEGNLVGVKSLFVYCGHTSRGDSGAPLYAMSPDWRQLVRCLYGVTTHLKYRHWKTKGNPDYVPEMYFASIPFFHHWITKTMENAETSLE
ncbi:uncharacterized protein LOC142348365 [Convolutriloba macropyga]|uniref:uncharacterized protein LOC142348365 n=1 Tax=Convolutriloba macropyga TaxID=536237 RepID=UPI003F525B63